MQVNESATGDGPQRPLQQDQQAASTHHTRRDVVRRGVKLAFVAPVLSTFFAKDAYAATYSCYPAGHDCPGNESCCSASCNVLNKCD